MSKNIQQIIDYIDNWLIKNNKVYLTPPEANDLLEKAGLLNDRKERAGSVLRKLLRNGMLPHAYQIGGRWFIPRSKDISRIEKKEVEMPKTYDNKSNKSEFDYNSFMDYNNFKRVNSLSKESIPTSTGLYAICIDDENYLPNPFSNEIKKRNHKLLYIGISKDSLRIRLWESELHCHKPATFFRSMGAILGFTPEPGSLRSNSRNYKFSKENQLFIEQWMADHLLVNFVSADSNLEDIEKQLIVNYKPIINLRDNPYKMHELENLRNKCVSIGKANNGVL